MYEALAPKPRSQLAVRKSPSMPMLDITVCAGDMDISSILKCPTSAGRKGTPTPVHRKLKSAISLAVGILVCTLVLFALGPNSKVAEEPWRGVAALPRHRRLSNGDLYANDSAEVEFETKRRDEDSSDGPAGPVTALEGMGTLFRRGTRGMPQLVVAHLAESTTTADLRLFLRALHRSGIPSHADVVLLFPFRPVAMDAFVGVIREEENHFQKLLARLQFGHAPSRKLTASSPLVFQEAKLSVFNSGAYTRPGPLEFATESIWGRRRNDTVVLRDASDAPNLQPVNESSIPPSGATLATARYGAVVGFDVQELDPDDALSGFLDSPPIHLRRWLCYQMLLGMVRNKYRHVLLTEITGVVILTDLLESQKSKKDASQLHLFATAQKWSDNSTVTNGTTTMEAVYGKQVWNSLGDDEKRKKVITTAVILGGVRPVRSVAAAMATETVRVALLRKSRDSSFRDALLLSYLVHKSSALGKKLSSHLQVHESGTSPVNLLRTPRPSSRDSLGDFFRNRSLRNDNRFAVIQGLWDEHTSEARRKDILASLRTDMCRDLEVYADCNTDSNIQHSPARSNPPLTRS